MDSTEYALKHQQIRDFGFHEKEIAFFDLVNKTEEEICSYLPTYFFRIVLRDALNTAQRQILSDKVAAQHLLSTLGVRTPTLVGVWHPVFGMTADGRPMTTATQFEAELKTFFGDANELDLIFKPRDGGSGQHILAATFVKTASGDIEALVDGQPQSAEAFLANLPEDPKSIISGFESYGWAIQLRVKQHPEMSRFNASSLNTIRIGTYITRPQDGSDEQPEVLLDFACFRVGRKGSNSDNVSTGGLMIDVDLETGCLRRGRFMQDYGGHFVEEHPDHNLKFAGLKLPYWEESVALCLKIAKALPSVRSVGWDVAITEDGPLIIEGNAPWGVFNPQSQGVGYFTPERRARFEKSGDPMPAQKLPPLRALPGMSKREWMLYKWRKKRSQGTQTFSHFLQR